MRLLLFAASWIGCAVFGVVAVTGDWWAVLTALVVGGATICTLAFLTREKGSTDD